LGGAVAVRLAAELSRSRESPGGLVLRSAFSSLVEVAAYHYPWLPVRWALIDRFVATDHIRHVGCPVLAYPRGERHDCAALVHAVLYDAAPELSASGVAKMLLVIPGVDHNDVVFVAEEDVKQALRAFLQRTGIGVHG
jgi:uncharacterized protein